ncbi:unnamed protein product [Tuber aestivum]|uniref:Mitochondrial adapter protein MCP1 transmembrane domain-containing protein n=1 Tax=Tuber aestivum TaxID=59557 RepID=A0A292PW00_9PEZI|nr:unnamed protein product [Tuber aestivum]
MSYNFRSELNVPRRFRDTDNISLLTMMELAPAPMEDEDYVTYFPTPPEIQRVGTDMSSSTGSLQGLSSSGSWGSRSSSASSKGVVYWLTRTQKYSSYAFTSFLGIHATTASITPLILGLDAGDSSLLLARTYYYQATPYIEMLLIPGSLALHIGSGFALRAYRSYQQRQRYGGKPPKSVSQWRLKNFSGASLAGYVMIPFVALHAALLRGVPLWVDGDSSQIGLEFLAHGFSIGKWGKWIGAGFYTAMVGLVSYHVVYGWAKYLKVSPRNRRITAGTAMMVAGAWLSGLCVVVSRSGPVRGFLGRHHDRLYNVFFLGALRAD